MRNPEDLIAYQVADELVLTVYEVTRGFPGEERFGLTTQLRRAAVSIPSNLVEGCSRNTQPDFAHFVTMAFGSARELTYQLTLSARLGYLAPDHPVIDRSRELCRILNALSASLRNQGH